MIKESITLLELNSMIQRVLRGRFSSPVWVRCEILRAKKSGRHIYIELVQKDDDGQDFCAKAAAVLWGNQLQRLTYKIPEILTQLLVTGVEVCIQVLVRFHEKYGMKLEVVDIDPMYTVGRLEQERQKIHKRIIAEGFHLVNKRLPLAPVLKNIAVISNLGAAGYQDFYNHLKCNAFGYSFQLTLFENSLQGERVRPEFEKNLKLITGKSSFDCIVLVRGGGSRLDLSAFDDYRLAVAIANSPLPVITGIGHEIDTSIADIVAHTHLKTPTAVAQFLIDHMHRFEVELENTIATIHVEARNLLQKQHTEIDVTVEKIRTRSTQLVIQQRQTFQHILRTGILHLRQQLQNQRLQLSHLDDSIKTYAPQKILSRGYSITRLKGVAIKDADDVGSGEEITTVLAKGSIQSRVT